MNTQPWTGRQRNPEEFRINLNANAPFFYMHSPLSWEYEDSEDTWLPVLSELTEEAGVNGVQQNGKVSDSTYARVHFMDQGYTILDYSELKYLARYKCRAGGYYYCDIHARPKDIAGHVIWTLDRKAYNKWRKSLVEEGYIEQVDPDICDMLTDRFQKRLRRLFREQHIPEIKAKMDTIKERVEKMNKATATIRNPPKKKKS